VIADIALFAAVQTRSAPFCARPPRKAPSTGRAPLAREHFVQHETQRVHIGPRRNFASFLLFRRHVGWGARDLVSVAPLVGEIRETKVREVRPTPPVDQHVRGLQIAMQDFTVVRRRKAGAQLPESSSALSGGNRPMRRSNEARSSPPMYSMERKCWPPVSAMSCTRHTFG
jgi:hypothetical protein